MPSANKHLKFAHRHLETAHHLTIAPDASWYAVATFYVAHALAHAVFDADPHLDAAMKHPENHAGQDLHRPGTNYVIKRHFGRVSRPYMDLYAISRGVRYEGSVLNGHQLAEVALQFSRVRNWAKEELEAAGRQNLPSWIHADAL